MNCQPCSGGASTGLTATADAIKEQGNAKFAAKEYEDAIRLYSVAIGMDGSNPKIYGNRAAAHYLSGAFNDCLEDSNTAISLDPTFYKGYLRKSKALIELGRFDDALGTLDEVKASIKGTKLTQVHYNYIYIHIYIHRGLYIDDSYTYACMRVCMRV